MIELSLSTKETMLREKRQGKERREKLRERDGSRRQKDDEEIF